MNTLCPGMKHTPRDISHPNLNSDPDEVEQNLNAVKEQKVD